MLTFLTFVHMVIFISLTLHALSRQDLSSTTRIAWIFTLLVLPFAGIVLYFLYATIRFNGRAGRAHRMAEKATAELVRASGDAPDASKYGPASSFATAINGFGVTQGNRAELLDSPDEQRARMIEDFDGATRFINVFYYIWVDDETGRAVAQALMRAVKRGVKVRAGVDQIGSRAFLTSQTWKDMKAAGIETQVALPIGNPFVTAYVRRLDLRNHRKITVIDGQILHCGSQNCTNFFYPIKPKYAPWIDVMVRFDGPVARQMDLLYAQTWFEDKPIDLEPWRYEVTSYEDGIPAQVVGTGPTLHKGVTAQLFARLISEARHEVILTTPYFSPGEVVVDAIMGAAVAGVDVTLNVPRRNDSGFVGPASRAYYPQLTEAGVKIAEFNGGLLHSKILTVDGEMVLFGSTNLDYRSFDLNFENDILVRDPKLTRDLRARQQEYLESSTPVDPQAVKNWPTWKRIWFNAFTVIGPLI